MPSYIVSGCPHNQIRGIEKEMKCSKARSIYPRVEWCRLLISHRRRVWWYDSQEIVKNYYYDSCEMLHGGRMKTMINMLCNQSGSGIFCSLLVRWLTITIQRYLQREIRRDADINFHFLHSFYSLLQICWFSIKPALCGDQFWEAIYWIPRVGNNKPGAQNHISHNDLNCTTLLLLLYLPVHY